jgi:hypothetical protein
LDDAVCVEIVIAPDEHGAAFSPSGVLFLRASVRACRSIIVCALIWLYNAPPQDSVLAASWKEDIHKRLASPGGLSAHYINPHSLQRIRRAQVEIGARKQQPSMIARCR